ncbi:hypothetical protein HDU78_010763 [Chytriomyces hyalinus]|nr:hypothetical protein HDU78_010763 [Chytriomyces hyalinus]
MVGAAPAVQAQIQKQIGAALNAQAGVSTAATAYQAQIQALQAQMVGAEPAIQAQIQKQIAAIMNAQAGASSTTTAQQAQIQALQAQMVGLTPELQARVQQQITNIQNGMTWGVSGWQWNGFPNTWNNGWNGYNNAWAGWNGWDNEVNSGWYTTWNGQPNSWNWTNRWSGMNANCNAFRAQINGLQNQMTGADSTTQAALQNQQQMIMAQMWGYKVELEQSYRLVSTNIALGGYFCITGI